MTKIQLWNQREIYSLSISFRIRVEVDSKRESKKDKNNKHQIRSSSVVSFHKAVHIRPFQIKVNNHKIVKFYSVKAFNKGSNNQHCKIDCT